MTEHTGQQVETFTQHLMDTFGDKIWDRFVAETGATVLPEYEHMQEIKTLQGQGGSFCRVFTADKIEKGAFLSISMGPMGRYINIHLMPEWQYDVPRLVLEGMISAKGGQVSLDLYPDKDLVPVYDEYIAEYAPLLEVYNGARANKEIAWEHSRQAFMRVFFSPFALLAFDVQPKSLEDWTGYADAYFDHWLGMLNAAKILPQDQAQTRFERRKRMKEILIANDPDRSAVVQMFGEELTSDIEQAIML